MLHFDLFQPLVRDFSNDIGVTTCRLIGHGTCISRLTAYNLGRRFGRLRANFAWLGVFSAANRVGRVLNLYLTVTMMTVNLSLLLLLMAWLLRLDNGLIRLKVFSNPLIYSLLANLVIICRLHFNHIFQIVYVTGPELLALWVGSSSARKLLVDIYACIALCFCGGNF